ncbi:MAG: adenylosuccinate lyase [Planctomycetota bacterium]|nr:adenylosuccinate lyase [Planctomycetota bacterium]
MRRDQTRASPIRSFHVNGSTHTDSRPSPDPSRRDSAPDAPDPRSLYASPLSGRYASRAMQAIWSERRKFETWRAIWAALARAQHELGLPVSADQAAALEARLAMTEDDFRRAADHERKLRHDVMAHVHALGDAAPQARGVIHLGATSQDINCNTEIPLIREALRLVCARTARVIAALADLAEQHADLPCLGFTHYQPAQPTTVGKRAAMWGSELALCLEHAEDALARLRLRGLKGATGTQASFLGLCRGDAATVAELERRVARALGWDESDLLIAVGQTYPRAVDAIVLSALACIAASLHKCATDVRLLCNLKELDEPFEKHQIGSSAMPYKRNPMRCERICGLSRWVISAASSAYDTAAVQWLERSLDDSANRRLSLPEAFLALDGCLELAHNVFAGLIVHEGAVRRNLAQEMPFLASEDLMLAAAALGRDRQQVHEAIRTLAQETALDIKDRGEPNTLLEKLAREPLLAGVDLSRALDPSRAVGLAPQQARRWAAEVAGPVRRRYQEQWGTLGDSAPSV